MDSSLRLSVVMPCLNEAETLEACIRKAFQRGAVVYWGERRFGDIDPTFSMRLVIPGAILFALGLETLFASFFVGALNIKFKRTDS